MVRYKASITIFLSLILVVFFALICIVLESARVSSCAARAKSITHISSDSCFARYSKEVFEDYGIFVLNCTLDDLKSDYLNICEKNCDMRINKMIDGLNLFKIKVNGVSVGSVKKITDDNGEIFANQVCEYMKYKIPESMIKKLVDKNEQLNQGESAGEECNKVNKCNEIMEKVEKDLLMMKENCDALLSIKETLNDCVIKVKNNGSAYYGQYVSWHDDVKEYLENIVKYGNAYTADCNSADASIIFYEAELHKNKDDYTDEVYDTLQNEFTEMKKNTDLKIDVYNAVKTKTKAKELLEILNKVDANIKKYKDSDFKSVEYANYALDESDKFLMVDMGIKLDGMGQKKADNVYKDKVSSIVAEGILALVVEDVNKISKKEINKENILSSCVLYNSKSNWSSWNSKSKKATNKVLLSEYVMEMMGNYRSCKEGKLDYQVEYIIAGKNTDKDNLGVVAERIMLIRNGFNFISLLKDSGKRNEAYMAAVAIAGASCVPAIVRVVQFGIMFAWSTAESITDTRNILDGRKVAVIKRSEQWNLSLQSIMDAKNYKKEKDDSAGIGYEDYLRALLYCQNKVVQSYRIMDVIQMNINSKYNDSFSMDKCITSATFQSNYLIEKVFAGLIVEHGIPQGSNYTLNVTERFSY